MVVLGVVTGAVIAAAVRSRAEPLFEGRIAGRVGSYVTLVGRILPFVAIPLVIATLIW